MRRLVQLGFFSLGILFTVLLMSPLTSSAEDFSSFSESLGVGGLVQGFYSAIGFAPAGEAMKNVPDEDNSQEVNTSSDISDVIQLQETQPGSTSGGKTFTLSGTEPVNAFKPESGTTLDSSSSKILDTLFQNADWQGSAVLGSSQYFRSGDQQVTLYPFKVEGGIEGFYRIANEHFPSQCEVDILLKNSGGTYDYIKGKYFNEATLPVDVDDESTSREEQSDFNSYSSMVTSARVAELAAQAARAGYSFSKSGQSPMVLCDDYEYQGLIQDALNILKDSSPDKYELVTKNVQVLIAGLLEEYGTSFWAEGGRATGVIGLGWDLKFYGGSNELACVITHEAQHQLNHRQNPAINSVDDDLIAYTSELSVADALGETDTADYCRYMIQLANAYKSGESLGPDDTKELQQWLTYEVIPTLNILTPESFDTIIWE